MTSAEARFNKSLRSRKPEGSLGRTAQDVHLDSHTAPELWGKKAINISYRFYTALSNRIIALRMYQLEFMPGYSSVPITH